MIMKMSSACNSSICIWLGTDHLIFFSDNTIVFNIRLYDKNSESDYFLIPPPKSEYFFSNIGNQNIFLEKQVTSQPFMKKLFVELLN